MQQCHTDIKRHDEGSFRTTRNNAQPSHNSPQKTEIMAEFLQLAVWNANGLTQNKELKISLSIYDIDVRKRSSQKNFLRIPHYIVYHTIHPAGIARRGTAIFIKSSI
jgi:hypothetical protein